MAVFLVPRVKFVKRALQIRHLGNKVPASMVKDYPLSNFAPYREGRNPYRHKILELSQKSTTILGDQYTESRRGNWLRTADPTSLAALQFEIGSYHGETSIEMAKKDPNTLFLGMEWKHKQTFKAGKKAADLGLKNICFLRGNCARLPMVLAKGEVDRFLILFPDPWGRYSQNKWRLLNPDFIQILSYLLKPNGQIFIKTDHEDYANYIGRSLEGERSIQKMLQDQTEELWQKIPPSPYERIFRSKNLPIYSYAYEKVSEVVFPERVLSALKEHGCALN